METATIWLLISIGVMGNSYAGYSTPSHVIERFPTLDACAQVATAIRTATLHDTTPVRCVQATIIFPKVSK